VSTALNLANFALRNLGARIVHSLLCILGVAVALAGGIALVGVSESVEQSMRASYGLRQVDLIVLQANKPEPMTSRLDLTLGTRLSAVREITSATPLLVDFLSIDLGQTVLVYGWPADSADLIKDRHTNERLQRGEVLVGKGAAAFNGLEVGDRIALNLGDYRVAGIFSGGSFLESGVLYMRLDDLQHLAGAPGQVTFFLVHIAEDQSPTEVAARLEASIPEIRVVTGTEFIAGSNATATLRLLSRITLFISAVLAALIVAMMMVLTLSQRLHEIAILRAVGWGNGRIARLVLIETTTLTLAGTLLGLPLGWLALQGALHYLRGFGVFAESTLTPIVLAAIAGATLLVAGAGAAVPVYHALRVRVVEHLGND